MPQEGLSHQRDTCRKTEGLLYIERRTDMCSGAEAGALLPRLEKQPRGKATRCIKNNVRRGGTMAQRAWGEQGRICFGAFVKGLWGSGLDGGLRLEAAVSKG